MSKRWFNIEGYDLGDRLLEGILFTVTLNDDNTIDTVKVVPEAEGYFSQLNTKLWEKEAEIAAQDYLDDILGRENSSELLEELLKEKDGAGRLEW